MSAESGVLARSSGVPASERPDQDAPLIGELQTVADRQAIVLGAVSEGLVLTHAAARAGITRPLILEWATRDVTFARCLSEARAAGCEALEHQIQTLADELPPPVARVKSENLKWLLSKRDPATYSDRMQLDVHSTVDVAGALSAARDRVAMRLGRDPNRVALMQGFDSPEVIEVGSTDPDSVDEAMAAILE